MANVPIKNFEDLEVWRRSHQLVKGIYCLTANYPAEERYGLISQMRRSAVSIPSNIAEGFGRRGKGDKIYFYNIAHSSTEELRYQLILSKDLGYIDNNKHFLEQATSISKMLTSLVKAIEDS